MKKVALIMAGGYGERFWPRSRRGLPKQFLPILDNNKTMLQLTFESIRPLIDIRNIMVVTNVTYKNVVVEQLPDLPASNIICEPIGRNTAPCIGLSAIYIAHRCLDAVMIVLPADHLIKNNKLFLKTLKKACKCAEIANNLVTIGVYPYYPETGYGYIKMNPLYKVQDAYAVEEFVEKPDLQSAERYLKDGEYFWNSGIFVWKTSSILRNISLYLPAMYAGLMLIAQDIDTIKENITLNNIFSDFQAISIDYGVMEKAQNVYIVPGDFGWDDIGSWLALERIHGTDENENTLRGNVIAINTNGCTVEATNKLIAVLGISNVIVVDTPDVTLICDKFSVPDIKKILEKLKKEGRDDYL